MLNFHGGGGWGLMEVNDVTPSHSLDIRSMLCLLLHNLLFHKIWTTNGNDTWRKTWCFLLYSPMTFLLTRSFLNCTFRSYHFTVDNLRALLIFASYFISKVHGVHFLHILFRIQETGSFFFPLIYHNNHMLYSECFIIADLVFSISPEYSLVVCLTVKTIRELVFDFLFVVSSSGERQSLRSQWGIQRLSNVPRLRWQIENYVAWLMADAMGFFPSGFSSLQVAKIYYY